MLSIYSSAFNLNRCKFDYAFAIDNYCKFADEVVISTIKDSDDSYSILESFKSKYSNLSIILSELQPNFPSFDGAIKDIALQNTFQPIKIQLDLDEYIPLQHKPRWLLTAKLLHNSQYDSFMLPVIDLYKDKNHCRNVGFKWRIHKTGLKRGVVNFAKRADGTHDIQKSDSCELLKNNGELASCLYAFDPSLDIIDKLYLIREQQSPYVIHTGYLDLDRREHINKEFWKEMWAREDGKEVKLDDREKLETYKSYEHGLEI